MSEVLDMAAVAALVGDPARANILCALLDGRALTAGELAYAARVSPQTTSGHLGKLAAARLIESKQQGRHRYYHLAGVHVSRMLESIMAVVAIAPPRQRPCRVDETMRAARLCYDHVAGRLGVALADALQERGHVVLSDDGGEVTPAGVRFFGEIGIDIEEVSRQRRAFFRTCVDWSERRLHVAGAVGASLAQHLIECRWVERVRDGRALRVTPAGRRGLEDTFGLTLHRESRTAPPAVAAIAGRA